MNIDSFALRDRGAGVLYAEDFSAPVIEDTPCVVEDPVPVEVLEPLITEQDLRDAESRGYADGLAAARAEHLLEKKDWDLGVQRRIQVILEQFTAATAERARESAETITNAVFKCTAALFPERTSQFGLQEREALLKRLVPMLRRLDTAFISAPQAEIASLSAYCSQHGVKEVTLLADDNLASGDFRISWDGGSVFRDAAGVSQHIIRSILPDNDHDPKISETGLTP